MRIRRAKDREQLASMITIGIIVVTAIISLMAFRDHALFEKLCLDPYLMHRKKGEYFRFISVGFVHADVGHLAFNMLTLFFFGKSIEEHIFSEMQFLLFYFSALVLSSVHEYQKQKDNPAYKACGASGAVSSILFSMVLFQPWGLVYLHFFIPLYFILFAAGYLAYSYYMQNKQKDNIAHGVHLWGALYGIAFTLLMKPEALRIFLDKITRVPFL